jgi:cell division protein FtsW (lipid II flippase)
MSWVGEAQSSTSRRGSVDVVLAAIVIALLGFGVVMVYSASVIEATVVFRDPQYFLKRQLLWCSSRASTTTGCESSRIRCSAPSRS